MPSRRYPHRMPERDRRMAESRRATARAARSAQRVMLWGLARGSVNIIKSLVVAAAALFGVCIVLGLFSIVLPYAIGFAVLIVAVVFAVVLVQRHKQQASPAEDPPAQGSQAEPAADEVQRCELLRHMEILKDCEELVNSSNNFSTVLSRYDLLLQELSYFAAFEEIGPDYLPSYGINFKTPASELWTSMMPFS